MLICGFLFNVFLSCPLQIRTTVPAVYNNAENNEEDISQN